MQTPGTAGQHAGTTPRPTSAVGAERSETSVRRSSTDRARTADLVRVLLFTVVVIAHSSSAINGGTEIIRESQLLGTLCHMSRYAFVAVTLYVLVVSMRGREMSPVAFWRRRFGLIVLPYLLWTIVYAFSEHIVNADNPFPPAGEFVGGLGHDLLTGEGKYQLYFLLISMQIYLFFPLIAWGMKKTRNHPWLVLAAAGAVQLALSIIYYLPRPSGDGWAFLFTHMWKTLPMYALFAAIGVLAATHHEAVDRFIRKHVVGILLVAAACTAFSVTDYWRSTSPGNVPPGTNTAWNPALIPWLVAALVMLWMFAMTWNDLRESGRAVGSRAVHHATLRAFGVFAIHPLVLDILGRIGFLDALFVWFPASATARTIVLVVVVLAISLVLVDLIMRTPLSKALMARARLPVRKPRAPETSPPAPSAASQAPSNASQAAR